MSVRRGETHAGQSLLGAGGMEAEPHPHHTPSLYCRYEDEINRRTAAENEFVVLKKVRGGIQARCGEHRLKMRGTGGHVALAPEQSVRDVWPKSGLGTIRKERVAWKRGDLEAL